ncbi:MAG: flagellar type III secretion system pore protein FliP [Planctomycetes bacterium]|nr:flagellar type III secretion system pore protein FliP [Planctomycetota bacterium]
MTWRRWVRLALVLIMLTATPAAGQDATADGARGPEASTPADGDLVQAVQDAAAPDRISTSIQILLMLTVLSLAPSILIMMTCFTRIIVVLGLLRQAMATQQLPPNQVLIGLALFMTFVVMAPTYNQVHDEAIGPYLAGELNQAEAFGVAVGRIREFMITQIESADNTDDVYLFLDEAVAEKDGLVWGDVPTLTLIPSFVVSELKTAFLIGFRIYLPFLVIDMVIASVLISMGMLMLPPVLISLPFKLLLFVLVDGWHLVVGTLMMSFT